MPKTIAGLYRGLPVRELPLNITSCLSAACCRRLLSACRKSAIADATALQERLDMQYISSTVRMANVISPSRNQTELPFVAP